MAKRDNISPRAKMILLYLILVIGFGILIIWAMVKVIWIDGDMWRQKAESRTMNYVEQPARRGNIYSSDYKILATTVPECDLYLDFSRRPELNNQGRVKRNDKGDTLFYTPIHDTSFAKYLDSVCIILHNAFPDSSVSSFRNRLLELRGKPRPGGCLRIKRHVPYSDWDRICKLPGWSRGVVKYVDGKSVIHNKRFHTYGNLAESVIGFNTSYYDETYNGLEGYYDSILRGHDGLILCRRLTRGSWIPVENGTNLSAYESDSVMTDSIPGHPVIDGLDIIATIDSRLQDIAHYSLERTLRRLGSSAGCAILMEVETGNVLVCSSLVLDTTGVYVETPNRNVPLADLYEPGSIFKPVLLTAMFNDPLITLDTSMPLHVGVKRFSAKSAEVKDHGLPNAIYPLWKAVAVSSNVAFCELAWQYYNERRDSLLSYVKAIFPYERLNVDIKGPESKGRTNKLTYDNDFLRFCYGYTSSVSPLRMATFYNAIANKGRMVRPRFCKGIINREGKVEQLPVSVLKESICSEEVALKIRDLLIGVVEGGTGDNIKNDTYSIAGKTGTAETAPGAATSNATFVGFFPADNPKYTCLVLMRDIYRFGRDAAPVFQDIADCVVSLDKDLSCRPTIKYLAEKRNGSINDRYMIPTVSKAPQASVRKAMKQLGMETDIVTHRSRWCYFRDAVDSIGQREEYVEYDVPTKQVPNCYGMTIKDAIMLCRSVGLDVTFEGIGKVVSQEPRARTPLPKEGKVHLILRNKE